MYMNFVQKLFFISFSFISMGKKSATYLCAYSLAYFLKTTPFMKLKPSLLSLRLRHVNPGVKKRCGFEVIAGLFL